MLHDVEQTRIARRLMPVVRASGKSEPPKQITIGYYRRLDNPPGAIAFSPPIHRSPLWRS